MLRLAWCSPLPPTRSGIADYSVEFLEELTQHAQVTLFIEDPAVVQAPSLSHLPRYHLDELGPRRFDFDLLIYQMGNHAVHEKIYQHAVRFPGIVVLHEFALDSFWARRQADPQRQSNLVREMIYEQDWSNLNNGRSSFIGMVDSPPPSLFNKRLITSALGIVTHSRYAAEQVRASYPHNLFVSKLLRQPRAQVAPWPDPSPIVFACGGQITPAKQIGKVLTALQRLVDAGHNVRLKLIGEPQDDLPLERWVAERNLQNFVTVTGFIDSTAAFEAELATAHVIINLREPTIGETSAVVVRALAQGRPVLVTDHGWYAELPDCCPKIQPGSVDDLVKVMTRLATDVEHIQQLGQQGLDLIKNEYAPAVVVQQFIGWLEQTINRINSVPPNTM